MTAVRNVGETAVMIICAVAVCLGVVFRFTDIDRKIYGFDETVTSIRVAGSTLAGYDRAVHAGALRSVADVRAFLHPRDANAAGTIASLAVEDPQHPPLYYVLERYTQLAFGDSVTVRRMSAVIAGVLLIPAAAWFAFELLGSWRVAAATAAIVAVSPLQLWYAQTAREYSLWTLLTALTSALLLRASRQRSTPWWAAYGVAATAGLYTFPFFFCVLLAHAVYVAKAPSRRAIVRPFLLCVAAATLLFSPWLFDLYVRKDEAVEGTTWLAAALPLKLMAQKWAFSLGAVFFDSEYTSDRLFVVAAACVVLAAVSLVVVALHAPRPAAWLLLALAASTALVLVIPDLVLHQSRSTAPRYLMATWLALEIAVAYVVAARPALLLAVLSAGIFASLHGLPLQVWWPDNAEAALAPAAEIVGDAPRPTLLLGPMLYAAELSNRLEDGVALAHAPQTGRDNFVLAAPSDLAHLQFAGWHAQIVQTEGLARASGVMRTRTALAAARGTVTNDELQLYRFVPEHSATGAPV